MRNSLASSLLVLVIQLTIFCSSLERVHGNETQQDVKQSFNIPNPFEKADKNLYFLIESSQFTLSSHHRTSRTKVEEYFSLRSGLSYSLHRDTETSGESYALISDSSRLRSYIVRNPDVDADESIDCELDHVHNHKSVFPWQFTLTVESKSDNSSKQDSQKGKKRDKKRQKWSSQRSIYGAGAVWLNAIERGLTSDQVGHNSPYSGSNLWIMRDADLEVRLLFDKPDIPEYANHGTIVDLIASSKLIQIQIKRLNSIQSDRELEGTSVLDESVDLINVNGFYSNIGARDDRIDRMFSHLRQCRASTKMHRVFPSLMRAISLSPEQMYSIGYVQQRSERLGMDDDDDSSYHEQFSNRIVHTRELVDEWFSFKHEAQVTTYELATSRQLQPKGVGPSNNISPEEQDTIDVYLKRFTEKSGSRSSRHSTAYYHFRELHGQVIECWPGQKEPAPSWFSQLMRAVHFRRPGGQRISGTLTGIGALLMNAADAHYKEFSMFRREIDILYDPSDLSSRITVKADEWQLYDKQTKFLVMFYFAKKNHRQTKKSAVEEQMDINDLVRIDVLDTMAKMPEDEAIGTSKDDNNFDLIIRYEILFFSTNRDPDELDFYFKAPEECEEHKTTTNEPPVDSDSDEEYLPKERDDFSNYLNGQADDGYDESDDVSDDAESHDHKQDQEQGEEFEFEPGKLTEDFPFPDFFTYFESHMSYKAVTSMRLPDSGSTQVVYMEEIVDLEIGLGKIRVFRTKDDLDQSKPELEFFFNYNMNIIVRRELLDGGQRDVCKQVAHVDPWLRLLSAELSYLRHFPNTEPVKTTTRLYGLGALWRQASISSESYFLGARDKGIEERCPKDGCKYREFVWASHQDQDMDLRFEFRFLWNMTKLAEKSAAKRTDEPDKLLTINQIDIIAEPNFEFASFDPNRETLFKSVRLGPLLSIQEITYDDYNAMSMPKSCQEAIEAHGKTEPEPEKKSVFDEEDFRRVPSFWDFIKPTNSYSAKYTVSHAPRSSDTMSVLPPKSTTISEFFDRSAGHGKLVIGFGPETREIYLDINKRTIYSFMPASNLCKRLAQLPGLLDTKSRFEQMNEDFNLDQMYGLAALWIRLANLKHMNLDEARVAISPDKSRKEIRTFRTSHEIESTDDDKVHFILTASFEASYSASRRSVINSNEFKLTGLTFEPRFVHSHSSRVALYKTQIDVNELESISPLDWQIPDECRDLSDETPLGPIHAENQFPRLSNLLDANSFHVRAEVAINMGIAGSSLTKVFITDETYRANDLRFSTLGLNSDLDILLYFTSAEIFDLSKPFKCPERAPPFELRPDEDPNGFRDFWFGKKMSVNDPGELYFAPLALWLHAERNIRRVKLSSSTDLVPGPETRDELDGKLDGLEQEMRTDVWTVYGTDPVDGQAVWSYDMIFERIKDKSQRDDHWHVLQKIRLFLCGRPPGSSPAACQVEIDVHNYRYKLENEEILRKFMLPTGKGCLREGVSPIKDVLSVDWDDNYQFWYQASLDIPASDNSTGQWLTLPTISGVIFRSKQVTSLELLSQFQTIHYQNGTSEDKQTIVDAWYDVQFDIDPRSGKCLVARDTDSYWRIKFPIGNEGKRYVTLVMDKFAERNLLRTDSNRPINAYRYDGYEITKHETSFGDLFLKVNGDALSMAGPVRIVSTFKVPLKYALENKTPHILMTREHSGVQLEVLIFDEDKKTLKGRLNLLIRSLGNVHLSQVAQHIDVSQCINHIEGQQPEKQVRHFAISYRCSFNPKTNTNFNRTHTLDEFIIHLMSEDDLRPTQLVGTPKMDLDSMGLIRFVFSLVEPPTAIDFGPLRFDGSRMNDELEYRSEMKLSPSPRDCSKWCDQLDCVAMSYCMDNSCRVLSKRILCQDDDLDNCQLDQKVAQLAKQRVEDYECNFYYWPKNRTASLDSFVSSLSSRLNIERETKTLRRLSISLKVPIYETILPQKFIELKDNLIQSDQPLNREVDHFKTLHKSKVITAERLQELASRTKRMLRFTKTISASLNGCLSVASSEYELISYCKSSGFCLILENNLNREELTEVMSSEEEVGATSCSVLMRNNLVNYQLFRKVRPPKSWNLLINDITANECASRCKHQAEEEESQSGASFTCLSFDFCRGKDQELGTCHLQKSHIATSDFDRSTFEPYWRTTGSRTASSCDHYSKSVLADFRHLPRKKLSSSDDKMAERLVVGSTAEACAISCLEDELCPAFEYCLDYQSRGTQSCYIIGQEIESISRDKLLQVGPEDFLLGKLEHSETCSLYVLAKEHDSFEELRARNTIVLEEASHGSLITVNHIPYSPFTWYVVLAALLGLVIQFSYIKLRGRPIPTNMAFATRQTS